MKAEATFSWANPGAVRLVLEMTPEDVGILHLIMGCEEERNLHTTYHMAARIRELLEMREEDGKLLCPHCKHEFASNREANNG